MMLWKRRISFKEEVVYCSQLAEALALDQPSTHLYNLMFGADWTMMNQKVVDLSIGLHICPCLPSTAPRHIDIDFAV